MRFSFQDYPIYVAPEAYEDAIQGMVSKLAAQPGAIAVYQIGGINDPGISDIDLLIILDDGAEFPLNPLQGLSKEERYLFLHPPFGASRSDFLEAQRLTFFHNYRLRWGQDLYDSKKDLSHDQVNALATQTALEYLLQMYISLSIQRTYRTFKIRELMLHARGLLYDLDLMGVSSGRLRQLIGEMIEWRKMWFETGPRADHLEDWIEDCYRELSGFLESALRKDMLFLPSWAALRISKNVTLSPSKSLSYAHRGFVLPSVLSRFAKKYSKFQRKLNQFTFFVPIERNAIPSIVMKRNEIEYSMVGFTRDKHLMPLKSPMNYLRNVSQI